MKNKQFQAIFALNLTIIFSGCFGYNQPQIPKELQNCNNDVTPICVYEFDYTKADFTHETAIKIDRFCQNLPREKLLEMVKKYRFLGFNCNKARYEVWAN
ncbi:MAG: hypothetical protein ACTTIV_05830 [Campylobacter sp.]